MAPMPPFPLAVALGVLGLCGAPPGASGSAPRAGSAVARRQRALADRQACAAGLSSAAELLPEQRFAEAEAARGPCPERQPQQWTRDLPGVDGIEDPRDRDVAVALWAARHGVAPRLAVTLLLRAQSRGFALGLEQRLALASAHVQLADVASARTLLAAESGTSLSGAPSPTPNEAKSRLDALDGMTAAEDWLERLRLQARAAGLNRDEQWMQLHVWSAQRPLRERSDALLEVAADAEITGLAREAVLELGAGPKTVGLVRKLEQVALRNGDVDAAMQAWRYVLDEPSLASEHPAARLRQAFLLRVADRCGDALRQLRELEGDPVSEPSVLWEEGHCLMRLGRYEEALERYREVEIHEPFQACCDDGDEEASYAIHQGEALERMGRIPDAAGQYLRAARARRGWVPPGLGGHLIELYAASGQLDDLARLLASGEGTFVFAEVGLTPLLRLWRDAEVGDVRQLLQAAAPQYQPDSTRLLCVRRPDLTPTLIQSWDGSLGDCGTPEALALLERRLAAAVSSADGTVPDGLVGALLAIPGGRSVLEERAAVDPAVRRALVRVDSDRPFWHVLPFPPVSATGAATAVSRLPVEPPPAPKAEPRHPSREESCGCM